MSGKKSTKSQASILSFFSPPIKRASNDSSPFVQKLNSAKKQKQNSLDDHMVVDLTEEDPPLSYSGMASSSKRKALVIHDDSEDDENIQETPLKRIQAYKMSESSPSSSFPSTTPSSVRMKSAFIKSSAPSTGASTKSRTQKFKEKNVQRYSWLLEPKDAMKRGVNHPDYDSRTLNIPLKDYNDFTDFERQFWDVKKIHWDTIVFFKKGKFYELYENDADVGHKHFDLKLTDRVNMRMVGVPESSFSHWASQFVAKGYKVAKVDQMENSVGKSLREKDSKKEKVIRRELTCVLTAGTLVDSQMLTNDMSTYCMSIKESGLEYGVTFVDTSTSEFHMCVFQDDTDLTLLETLLMQIKPRELVLEKGKVSKKLAKLLKNVLNSGALINYLAQDTEFWSPVTTLDEIDCQKYFEGSEVPACIEAMKGGNAMSALGGLIYYLRCLKLDKSLVSSGNFLAYDPVRQSGTLVLDGQTLANLEIFDASVEGGSLYDVLCKASTPFGKRMFKTWMCHPLRDIIAINQRLDAIDELDSEGPADNIRSIISKLPDLERVISRIHGGNCRVKDFMGALSAFRNVQNLFSKSGDFGFKGDGRLMSLLDGGFDDKLIELLLFFEEAIDEGEVIIVKQGFDAEYDTACEGVAAVESKLDDERKLCAKSVECRITFKDIGKELFQMEVPVKTKVPNSWTQMSKTAQVIRYWSPKIKGLTTDYAEAKEIRDESLRSIKCRLFERFDTEYALWLDVIKRVAELDCLMGLALCKDALGDGPVCRPVFVGGNGDSVFEVEELRHPCIVNQGSAFIPNDTMLGGGDSNIILLTGAQLGSYVPCTSLRMTTFDRIFTRIGANDNILAGQSTFMVELAETSRILREASPRSLVILDELGRGTSTFDGYAIAYAVLFHLAMSTRCLGLFSTHYQMLTNEFKNNPMMFMNFYSDDDKRDMTFLYKLTPGVCSKSYGMVVATMAGIPMEIIESADVVAAEFEKSQQWNQTQEASSKANLSELALFNLMLRCAGNEGKECVGILRGVWKCLKGTREALL